ncbi:MAG TPA: iron-containing redox enzyme family protein [Candidatus Angelobacter sp.]|jgi:pyrroloquinoline quinone (PQQ) biosynthesis protein C/quercetin dioxygenase-like cupin family protein|nr:iron-containing redox enzyme family protein [Candidatus Angelobacter sp.]
MTLLAENTHAGAGVAGSHGEFQELERFQAEHPIWDCRLIRACRAGLLTKEDYKLIFSQYYRYSKNFTRYLTALMTNCESDYYRSRLSENLWEEGGGAEPDKRHAELFRRFLRDGLGVDLESIQYQSFANDFFHQYLDFCRNSSALTGSAFLSLGTEGAISRLYGYFCEGLLKAGIPEEQLNFFRIHMECDDEHAITLGELMRSYSDEAGWFEQCKSAINHALNIRRQFLDDALDFVLQTRVQDLMDRVRGEHSLIPKDSTAKDFVHAGLEKQAGLSGLYSNKVEHLNIDFSVNRIDFGAEVFDVRLVNIKPHRNTEHHRHAHESLLTVTKGKGRVLVGDFTVDVAAGDTVFVPRWAMHQTQNTGDESMELLAVTDYGLTRHAFLGDHLRSTRMNPKSDADSNSN